MEKRLQSFSFSSELIAPEDQRKLLPYACRCILRVIQRLSNLGFAYSDLKFEQFVAPLEDNNALKEVSAQSLAKGLEQGIRVDFKAIFSQQAPPTKSSWQ